MRGNNQALIRYRAINQCIKDYKYVSRKKLISACEKATDTYPIAPRTFDGDLHDLRHNLQLGYLAPIEYDRSKKAYFYKDPDYSIDNIPLNQEEIQTLLFAASLLDQYKNLDVFNEFSGSIQKIINTVNFRRDNQDWEIPNFIDFEKVSFQQGSQHLDPIIKAIRTKVAIKITYRAFHAENDHYHTIHPYLLKEYHNRWYLIGFHDYRREIRIYGLDRIVKIEERPDIIFYPSDFEPEEYFKNTIGIFSPLGEPPEVVLQFKKETANYLLTQPIHESQKKIKEDADFITFSFKVHPTVEFIQMILGWGSEVKVVAPESLKDRIIEVAVQIITNYKKAKKA